MLASAITTSFNAALPTATPLLAAEGSRDNVFEIVNGVFSRPDALAHPEHLLNTLQHLPVVWGVVFLVAGLVCMLEGYKFYRVVTVVLALAVGVFLGYRLGQTIKAQYIVAACIGLLAATLCFPMRKYAVAALGGLVGAFLGANTWTAIGTMMTNGPKSEHCWIGALMGLIICGMLAFILWKHSIVLFTSISGSTIAVIGAVGLLLQFDGVRDSLMNNLDSRVHAVIPPLLVAVPAVIGLILQEAQSDDGGGEAEAAPKPA